MKQWTRLWAVSLTVLGCASLVLGGSQALGPALPDAAMRLVGVIDLIALAVFAFACVKRSQAGKDA